MHLRGGMRIAMVSLANLSHLCSFSLFKGELPALYRNVRLRFRSLTPCSRAIAQDLTN